MEQTLYRTVHQYNADPLPDADMKKLKELAEDYQRVKNTVYRRYGGIHSLRKLYPGYTVQNEMTKSGLRERLGMPSVYFYLAVFDALKDIKTQWSQVKSRILENAKKNESLKPEDRHYLRFVIKVNVCFDAIVLGEEIQVMSEIQESYERIREQVDSRRLDSYVRRQVRRHLKILNTTIADGFAVGERAYRYQNHGIYLTSKEVRKRIYVRLTDNNQYKKQLYIQLYPEENRIVIHVPVEVTQKKHLDYTSNVGIALGMFTMLTTDSGHSYGEQFGEYQQSLIDFLRISAERYRRNREINPGRYKYSRKKERLMASLHTYINQELNRFLKEEKPEVIYLPKLPQKSVAGVSKKINYSINLWQKGYVRRRLIQKCQEQSIEIVEVFGKGISSECHVCGGAGNKRDGSFICPSCGIQTEEKMNTARNVKKRGNLMCVLKETALERS